MGKLGGQELQLEVGVMGDEDPTVQQLEKITSDVPEYRSKPRVCCRYSVRLLSPEVPLGIDYRLVFIDNNSSPIKDGNSNLNDAMVITRVPARGFKADDGETPHGEDATARRDSPQSSRLS